MSVNMYKPGYHCSLHWFVGMLFLTNISFNIYSMQNPSKEDLDILRSTKTAKIVVKSSFAGADQVEKRIRETTMKLLSPAGMK